MSDPIDPHAEMLLSEFDPTPMLVAEEHLLQYAVVPAIDFHNHLGRRGGRWAVEDVPKLVEMMDACNLRAIVNLDGAFGDELRASLERYDQAYPGRFFTFAWVDWSRVDEPGFGEAMARQLEESVRAGARGLKVFKELGLRIKYSDGTLVRVDDERLVPIWDKAGELGVPVLIHVADPKAFFTPWDQHNERWLELRAHPDWFFYGPGFPPYDDLMAQHIRLVERHPNTTFVSAHVFSSSENLAFVSGLLDRFPNLNVDISARINELGRQPRAARRFFLKYADRVLFGTDSRPSADYYRLHFRFMETEDEYFPSRPAGAPGGWRWRIYGVDLPDDVLEKMYHGNAERLLGTSR